MESSDEIPTAVQVTLVLNEHTEMHQQTKTKQNHFSINLQNKKLKIRALYFILSIYTQVSTFLNLPYLAENKGVSKKLHDTNTRDQPPLNRRIQVGNWMVLSDCRCGSKESRT